MDSHTLSLFTCSLAALAHSPTQSLTHPLLHSPTHSLPHSLPHSLTDSLAHPLATRFTHSLTRPLHSLTHPPPLHSRAYEHAPVHRGRPRLLLRPHCLALLGPGALVPTPDRPPFRLDGAGLLLMPRLTGLTECFKGGGRGGADGRRQVLTRG